MNRLTSSRSAAWAACLAAVLCLLSLAGFALPLPGYVHGLMPVGLLGAQGVPRAQAFNLSGFIVPGMLMAWSALGLRAALGGRLAVSARDLPGGWWPRIGASLWLLSAIAFAAQGIWPLDPRDLDGATSQRHASMWTLWWIAFVPGALLLGAGFWRWRRAASGWALATGALVLLFAALPPWLLPGPLAQRVALAAWFLGYAMVARSLR
ncbi:DUF998 domain-containing protein [Aerolutibacter ruishenii]|uniref:DUF998 domain-containing protein n=1 Tax=Aerolutibacter ruishenii TaxID=686800 RepID=A0A562LST9_9GAMM|nr:DUF998 domain-containing protein [Lysobacter ruishenii]TWI10623.1 hypothetical protein IP93_01713 [Lysobacter ruishenii]